MPEAKRSSDPRKSSSSEKAASNSTPTTAISPFHILHNKYTRSRPISQQKYEMTAESLKDGRKDSMWQAAPRPLCLY